MGKKISHICCWDKMSGSACGKKRKSTDLVLFTDKKPHGEISWKIILEKVALSRVLLTVVEYSTYFLSCVDLWMNALKTGWIKVHIKDTRYLWIGAILVGLTVAHIKSATKYMDNSLYHKTDSISVYLFTTNILLATCAQLKTQLKPLQTASEWG